MEVLVVIVAEKIADVGVIAGLLEAPGITRL